MIDDDPGRIYLIKIPGESGKVSNGAMVTLLSRYRWQEGDY